MNVLGKWSILQRKVASEVKNSFLRKIHTQGSGLFGALGRGNGLKDSKHFEIVNRSEEDSRPVTAKQISAGWGHSAAVTEDGEVIVWGRPYDFSSLLRLKKLRDFSGGLARFVSKLSSNLGSEFDGLYCTPFLVNDLQKISSVHCSGGLTGRSLHFYLLCIKWSI
jgi:Regulator of chromosome condensation (RCC1) repeat